MNTVNLDELRIELIELEHEVAFRDDEIKELSTREMDHELKTYLEESGNLLEEQKTRLKYLRSVVK